MDRKRERDNLMTLEGLDNLKKLKTWLDEILDKADGFADALHKAEMYTECAIAKASINGRLEYIYSRIDEKILENEPITEEQHQEAEWESNTNR